MEKLIELKNVTYTYEPEEEGLPGYTAVRNVSLDINKGEFVAVLGHNGSGKSTLAKLMNAIFEPTEGFRGKRRQNPPHSRYGFPEPR